MERGKKGIEEGRKIDRLKVETGRGRERGRGIVLGWLWELSWCLKVGVAPYFSCPWFKNSDLNSIKESYLNHSNFIRSGFSGKYDLWTLLSAHMPLFIKLCGNRRLTLIWNFYSIGLGDFRSLFLKYSAYRILWLLPCDKIAQNRVLWLFPNVLLVLKNYLPVTIIGLWLFLPVSRGSHNIG